MSFDTFAPTPFADDTAPPFDRQFVCDGPEGPVCLLLADLALAARNLPPLWESVHVWACGAKVGATFTDRDGDTWERVA